MARVYRRLNYTWSDEGIIDYILTTHLADHCQDMRPEQVEAYQRLRRKCHANLAYHAKMYRIDAATKKLEPLSSLPEEDTQ